MKPEVFGVRGLREVRDWDGGLGKHYACSEWYLVPEILKGKYALEYP